MYSKNILKKIKYSYFTHFSINPEIQQRFILNYLNIGKSLLITINKALSINMVFAKIMVNIMVNIMVDN